MQSIWSKGAAVRATKAIGVKDKSEAKDNDPFSIISLNWDILLDNELNEALANKDGPVGYFFSRHDVRVFGGGSVAFVNRETAPAFP